MSFQAFNTGSFNPRRRESAGVGSAAGMVNLARTLQNIKANSPDYKNIFDTDIVNQANIRNTARDINSSLIAQKIGAKAQVRRSDDLLAAHKSGMSKLQSAQEGAAWKEVLGAGLGLLGGFIL